MIKDHIIAQVVNDLRDTAVKFHDTQQLRERLRGCIEPLLSAAAAAPQVVADERAAQHIPANFTTHRSAWRDAINECINVEQSSGNADQAAYWQHELAAFDRSFDRLLSGELKQATPVQAQEPVPEAAQQNGGLVRAALVDLLALERHALTGCLNFEAQNDCRVRFARARKALSAPVQPVAVPGRMVIGGQGAPPVSIPNEMFPGLSVLEGFPKLKEWRYQDGIVKAIERSAENEEKSFKRWHKQNRSVDRGAARQGWKAHASRTYYAFHKDYIHAAPAAQGDAKELTVEDLYHMYRTSWGKLNCEVDPFNTLDEMDQQAWRNMAAAIAAKAAS